MIVNTNGHNDNNSITGHLITNEMEMSTPLSETTTNSNVNMNSEATQNEVKSESKSEAERLYEPYKAEYYRLFFTGVGCNSDVNDEHLNFINSVPNFRKIHSRYIKGGTYGIHHMVKHGYDDVVKRMLCFIDVNIINRYGETPITQIGSFGGYCDNIVKILVTAGANVNIKDRNGKTPLYHVISQSSCNSSFDDVYTLLNAGADPNENNCIALYIAIKSGNIKLVKLLLDAGANYKLLSEDRN